MHETDIHCSSIDAIDLKLTELFVGETWWKKLNLYNTALRLVLSAVGIWTR